MGPRGSQNRRRVPGLAQEMKSNRQVLPSLPFSVAQLHPSLGACQRAATLICGNPSESFLYTEMYSCLASDLAFCLKPVTDATCN